MRLSGLSLRMDTLLLAGIFDCLNWLVWAKTKDGQKGANKPKSMMQALSMSAETIESDLETFASGGDFEKARERLLGG